jgi:hypothetical protein
MKKMHVMLAFAALFAFSAISVSSASALTFEKAHFLINAAEAPANTPIDATGEILFESVLAGASFICSGLFEGTAGPNGEGSITKVFNLAGTEIKELPATGISCTQEKTCESATANPDTLPFKVIAEKDVETGAFYVLIAGKYEFTCTVIGIKIEELCEPPAAGSIGGEVINMATDFEAGEATEPLATCNGNAEDGVIANIKGNLISSTAGNINIS